MRCVIRGTGSFLPQKILTNDDLAQFLDTSDEWISTRTGIKSRHWADLEKNETTSSMGIEAAKRALSMANIEPEALDLILVATVTPDYRLPSVACLIQEELKAKNAAALDISAACAGSIYALSIADSFIRTGKYRHILVVTSEMMSSIVDWQDRNTAVLFGDGASAAVLSSEESQNGFIDVSLYADGALNKTIWIKSGGSKHPLNEEALSKKEHKVVMNGREVYKFAVRAITEAIQKILKKNNLTIDDLACVAPHQANLRIIEAIGERLEIPKERFLINLDRCANTSAASLLLAYDEALRKGQIKKGDLILMLAIGAGFVWGAALYRA